MISRSSNSSSSWIKKMQKKIEAAAVRVVEKMWFEKKLSLLLACLIMLLTRPSKHTGKHFQRRDACYNYKLWAMIEYPSLNLTRTLFFSAALRGPHHRRPAAASAAAYFSLPHYSN